MKITLQPELFQTDIFQTSFKEKLKSSRYYDYSPSGVYKDIPVKHYNYTRAAKGVLAEFAFMGYLLQHNIEYVYNKKVDNREYSPDIDFYLPATKTYIDVKSGFSYWKKEMLLKYKINYVVVCAPFLHPELDGIYSRGNWMLVDSYRQLFKNTITVDLNGCISIDDIMSQGTTYTLKPIESTFV